MELEGCIESRKRVRDDSSFLNFLGSKIVRVDSIDFDFVSPTSADSELNRLIESEQIGIHADDSDLDSSPQSQSQSIAIQEDFLKILDESDALMDRDSAIQDLDSVIRSFEKEIHVPSVEEAIDQVVSESGRVSQPELGYLLEASDDELGLPPSADSGGEKEKIEIADFATNCSDSSDMKRFLGFEEEEAQSYCWFDSLSNENESEDVIALGGLFDCTDVAIGMEFPCRTDTMFCL